MKVRNAPLDMNIDTRTRGHTKKLVVKRCRYDVRKYSFCIRVVNTRNSLPNEVITTTSVNSFKNRLDLFWARRRRRTTMTTTTTTTTSHCSYHRGMARLSWPGLLFTDYRELQVTCRYACDILKPDVAQLNDAVL